MEYLIKNKVDPPLTPNGIRQAEQTGRYLKEYFEEEGLAFDKIIIESSPFLRTMMTASQIAH
jgi:broad specificity phosphatase PhoE